MNKSDEFLKNLNFKDGYYQNKLPHSRWIWLKSKELEKFESKFSKERNLSLNLFLSFFYIIASTVLILIVINFSDLLMINNRINLSYFIPVIAIYLIVTRMVYKFKSIKNTQSQAF